ncbi:hypothetical protein [Candidatus Clostridium radicumherbarum]|uniref:DUF4230 domain-containing protein n=1 Tax=Candidatus Clostridium radicumherbarum TaxID=3381662 RepID=A0ABW8TQD8_9CLOT
MNTLSKALADKIATIIIFIAILIVGFFVVKHFIPNIFGGTTSSQYGTVVEKFTKGSKLVVAGAESKTIAKHTFSNNEVSKWPDWSKGIMSTIVGRQVQVEVPVKTEFKLDLEGITKNDVTITDNTLTFNKPLTVEVDSQQDGNIKANNDAGIIDRVVDAATAGATAQEFLSKKTQETIATTSDSVMNSKDSQEIVRKYAEEALENLLNLDSKDHINVSLKTSDLKFVNVDK